jgi:hypothetical protein
VIRAIAQSLMEARRGGRERSVSVPDILPVRQILNRGPVRQILDQNQSGQPGPRLRRETPARSAVESGQKLAQQRLQLRSACAKVFTLAPDDPHEVAHCVLEIIVHDHVVEFPRMGHVADRVPQTSFDHLV